MATEKQIAANRANAQKSTGPKTAAGRSKSSRNAFRHGLTAAMALDMTVSAKVDTIARMLTCDDEKMPAATEVAQAQLEVLRIRAVRADMTAKLTLASADAETLRRLAALDKYERQALTKRRRASQKL
jgi:hypothetical protein